MSGNLASPAARNALTITILNVRPGSKKTDKIAQATAVAYDLGIVRGTGTGHVTSLKFKAAAQAQYIPLVVSVTPATTNAELSQLIADEIKKRGASNIYRFRIRVPHAPDPNLWKQHLLSKNTSFQLVMLARIA